MAMPPLTVNLDRSIAGLSDQAQWRYVTTPARHGDGRGVMERFEVEVDCVGGGTPHVHTIVVSCKDEGVYNVGPTKVRLHYACPTSGEGLVASIDAPASAGRPFKVERVL
jgi:hypothetical protein